MRLCAIVVAAGSGARFGGAKQFAALIDDTTVVDRAVHTASEACGDVVVALPPDAQWAPPAGVVTVAGGETRTDSVRAALAAVDPEVDVVVVHDAARPLASRALFERAIDAVRAGADAAVPALAVRDTVKRVDGRDVITTVPREGLYAAQTPQAFRASVLRAALAAGGSATDDAALVEQAGGRVVVVDGEAWNLKITTPADLEVARVLVREAVAP